MRPADSETVTALTEKVDFGPEMTEAFRAFGTYVNATRALPDVRDGLKPVHRRILFAMWQNANVRNGVKIKAAKAVGDTMGDYHPHGDAAIYSTMVGMSQSFSINAPLVDGRGNWGTLDDPPAAYRYTECLLHPAAHALLGVHLGSGSIQTEIDETAVDMVPNYNAQVLEPLVLPALWPAYVVNGSEGIGVGVAGRSAPHNLVEVMKVAKYLVDHTEISNAKLLSLLPGPEVPANCDIFDTEDHGILSYLTTGQGSFIMRARWDLEQYAMGKGQTGTKIIFTGLPFRVSADTVVEAIRIMIDKEMLPKGIEVANYSTDSMRVVLDIMELDPEEIIQRLLYHSRSSRLQETFSVSMNAIVESTIRTVSVVEAIQHWIAHRRTTVRRRTQHRMRKAETRIHLVDGFLAIIPVVQQVVATVMSAEDRAHASIELQTQWSLTEVQAEAVLDLSIAQLTRLGVDKYRDEHDRLQATIDACQKLLGDPAEMNALLKEEFQEIVARLGRPRVSTVMEGYATVSRPETPAVTAPVVNGYLAVTPRGWVRWVQSSRINRQTSTDYVTSLIPVTNYNVIEGISDLGWHVRADMDNVPKQLVNAKTLWADLLDPGENLVMVGSSAPWGSDADIVMLTTNGNIKRVSWDTYASHRTNKAYPMITMEQGERIAQAFFLPQGKDVLVATAYGRALVIDSDTLLAKGGAARGIPGVTLDDSGTDSVIYAGAVDKGSDTMMYWTADDGLGSFPVSEIPYARRGARGKTFTQSGWMVSGLTLKQGDAFKWYGAAMDEPQSATAPDLSNIKMTDAQLAPAPGVSKSIAVWSEEG